MSLRDCLPPRGEGVLARNGFALVSDLESPGYGSLILGLEAFQAEFLGLTRSLWEPDFPIPGDALAHFSRQWEFPYVWANIGPAPGRILEAGSGITFFPFLLAAAGFEVHCCDSDETLGLPGRYRRAAASTGLPVAFVEGSLTELPYPAGTFDVVTCISVLEHVGVMRAEIVAALATMLRPGGRLILTCDVDLRRESDLLVEDVGVLLAQLRESFNPVHTVDLRRPNNLLTSDYALSTSPWRLPPPWQPHRGSPWADQQAGIERNGFRSITVLGLSAIKRE